MIMIRIVVWIFSVGLIVPGAGIVLGQDFPNKPIRIVTGGIGGGADFVARLIAQGLTASLGQQVVVVNHSSGVIPGQTVAKASPDGYTLLAVGSTLWIGPLLQKVPPYDPVRDFAPVSLAITEPTVLVVHPSLPVKSVKDLIALAKAKPGALNYATGARGSSSHLATELFKAMAGVNIEGINYGSGSVRIADLLSGQTQVAIDTASAMMSHVKSGRLKALAVTSAQPSELFPELPTVAASGLPGFESRQIYGIFAPAKTPPAIIRRLNQEIARFLNLPETKAQLFNISKEATSSSPEELAAIVNSERKRLGKVIKDAGIRAE